MKKYKIEFQSFSDVITNSSSTVFLVDRNTAEELEKMIPDCCIYSHELTWDVVCPEVFNISDLSTLTTCQLEDIDSGLYHIRNYEDAIFSVLSSYPNTLEVKDQKLVDYFGIYGLDQENVKEYYDFCQNNKELIEDKLIGKVYVDIEDTEEVYDYAKCNSIWWEYQH